MAHEIDFSNGRANMAFRGETPWHGLGAVVENGASLEEWAKQAGLAWTALQAVVQYTDDEGAAQQMDSKRVIYRSDTKAPLSVMGDGYKIVQPIEVLEFYRDLTAKSGYEMETAGSLFGGRKIWALARTGNTITLPGSDTVESYLLLATSMDGSLSTTAKHTSVRVVCNNTLSMAAHVKDGVRVNHRTVFDGDRVKGSLGINPMDNGWSDFADVAKALAKRKVTSDEAMSFLLGVFAPEAGDDQAKQEKALQSAKLRNVWKSVTSSPGSALDSAAGTAWGLLNGATHFVDHVSGRGQNSRLNSAWFGVGDTAKQRAYDYLVDMIGGVKPVEVEQATAVADDDFFASLV